MNEIEVIELWEEIIPIIFPLEYRSQLQLKDWSIEEANKNKRVIVFELDTINVSTKFIQELKSRINKAANAILGRIYSKEHGNIYLLKRLDGSFSLYGEYELDSPENDNVELVDLSLFLSISVTVYDERTFYTSGPGARVKELDAMCDTQMKNEIQRLAISYGVSFNKNKVEVEKYILSLNNQKIVNSYSDMGRLLKELVEKHLRVHDRKSINNIALLINRTMKKSSMEESKLRCAYESLVENVNQGHIASANEENLYILVHQNIIIGNITAWLRIDSDDVIRQMTDDTIVGLISMFAEYHGRDDKYNGVNPLFVDIIKELNLYYMSEDRAIDVLSKREYPRTNEELCYHIKKKIIQG